MEAQLSEEDRRLLMDLARTLRTAAEQIDKLTKVKEPKPTDANGERKFTYRAKVTIPDDIFLTKHMGAYGIQHGFTPDEIRAMWEEFVSYYRKTLRKWADWNRVWFDWVRRERQRRAEKSPKARTGKDLKEFGDD